VGRTLNTATSASRAPSAVVENFIPRFNRPQRTPRPAAGYASTIATSVVTVSECETRPRACAAEDRATDVAVDDPTGEAFVYGLTASTNFPAEAPLQAASGGGQDAFVAVLNAAGNDFVYSTYLGGSGTDTATRIDLNSSGAAYVSGTTRSATGTAAAPSVTNDFPTTPGAFRPASGVTGGLLR
jgi:hypothetical protein